jgi:acyl carrier protein
MNTYTRIKDIIIEQTGCNADQVEPSARLAEDLLIDSLDHVEVTMKIEEEFDITIPDHEADGLRTVQDLVTAVEGRAA